MAAWQGLAAILRDARRRSALLRACESIDFGDFRSESNQGLTTSEGGKSRIDSQALRMRSVFLRRCLHGRRQSVALLERSEIRDESLRALPRISLRSIRAATALKDRWSPLAGLFYHFECYLSEVGIRLLRVLFLIGRRRHENIIAAAGARERDVVCRYRSLVGFAACERARHRSVFLRRHCSGQKAAFAQA